MHLAACLTSLPMPFEEAVRQAAALGFGWVDVVALADRPAAHLDALADTGVVVGGVVLGHGLPADCTLDAEPLAARKQALEALKRQVADAARLGASHGCLLVEPPFGGPGAAARSYEGYQMLADFAAGRQVRLCVGASRAGSRAVCDWLDEVGHPDLELALDIGACLRAGEDLAGEARRAKPRLGAVHVCDTDGGGERLPLFAGRLTPAAVERLLQALREVGYRGAVSLDLGPTCDQPVRNLEDGRAALQRVLSGFAGPAAR